MIKISFCDKLNSMYMDSSQNKLLKNYYCYKCTLDAR